MSEPMLREEDGWWVLRDKSGEILWAQKNYGPSTYLIGLSHLDALLQRQTEMVEDDIAGVSLITKDAKENGNPNR